MGSIEEAEGDGEAEVISEADTDETDCRQVDVKDGASHAGGSPAIDGQEAVSDLGKSSPSLGINNTS